MLECMRSPVNVMVPLITIPTAADTPKPYPFSLPSLPCHLLFAPSLYPRFVFNVVPTRHILIWTIKIAEIERQTRIGTRRREKGEGGGREEQGLMVDFNVRDKSSKFWRQFNAVALGENPTLWRLAHRAAGQRRTVGRFHWVIPLVMIKQISYRSY